MSPPSNPKSDLKALQAEWYAKLKAEGFKDIEQDEDNLIRWDSHHFQQQSNPTDFETKAEYYRVAGQLLHEHEFESEWEKLVWEMHSAGLSTPKIITELKARKLTFYKERVYGTIKKLGTLVGKQCQYQKAR